MLTMIAQSDFGPFGVMIGYVAAGMAAVSALVLTTLGPMGRLRAPDEAMPHVPQRFAFILIFVGMVGLWLYAQPETIGHVWAAAAGLGLFATITFVGYSSRVDKYRIRKPVANSDGTGTVDKFVIRGERLLPHAQSELEKSNKTIDELFADAQYNPNALWDPDDRVRVKRRILTFFLAMIVAGALAAASAGFAIQVVVTGEPAAPVHDATEEGDGEAAPEQENP